MIKNNVTGLQSIHWSFEKHTRSALLTLAASLLVAACGGGSSEDGASATGASSSSAAPDFASLEDCMSTQWILVADQATRGANAIAAPGVSTSTTGQALVDIARDGTYTYSPSFTINMQTPAGPASGRTSGTSRGTWSISGNNLVTTETSNNITGEVTGSFGSVPLPRITGFSSMTSTVLACNPSYFEYEVSAPTGNFTQRLVH